MGTLNGQIALEQRKQHAVPNGPECVHMEASFPPGRLPLADSHSSIRGTLSTAHVVRVSLHWIACTAGERAGVS